MDTLTEALRRAADDAPTDVGRPDAVEAAWAGGRRRRVAGRVGGVATVLAVVALVVGIVGGSVGVVPRAVVPADGGRGAGVSSYPQRIGHQWWVRDLPLRGGPVAGFVASGEGGAWQAVTPDGTRWALSAVSDATVRPAVSSDGMRVAWFQGGDLDRYIVNDRRTGALWFSSTVGLRTGPSRDGRPSRPHQVALQSPAFFSTDGSLLAVPSVDGVVVLPLGSGSDRLVSGIAQPAGWRDATHLVGRSPASAERVVEWDATAGSVKDLFTLSLPEEPGGTHVQTAGQDWATVVRGRLVVLLERTVELGQGRLSDDGLVVVRSLPGGEVQQAPGASRAGGPAWLASYPSTTGWLPGVQGAISPLWVVGGEVAQADEGGLGTVSDTASQRLVVAEDSVDAAQQVWAQGALDGGPTWSLFGTSTWLVTWWWKEIALAALALLGWRLTWWRVRLRRASRGSGATRRSVVDP